ncbi:MAG: DUF4160 domain-containing protein [Kastovskya adunca ATA6-11-RM4]|nr:DUF4160 domain-containing protein [Kastovskya adunca ATA6-11-RM4]
MKKDGFSVRIYTNDHLPSHVHVIKAGGEAKINLGSETEDPSLIQIWNMSDGDVKKALQLIFVHQTELLKKWSEIHEELEFN